MCVCVTEWVGEDVCVGFYLGGREEGGGEGGVCWWVCLA